jgi:phospholipid/cholesterol/gamma-HCH transport system ATP-binding protein
MGSIIIDKIVMQYSSTAVLNELSETVGDGEFFTILGSSGSGKSTILKTVSGLFPPTSGTVVIDGIDIFKLSKPAMLDFHKKSGFAFQNAALVNNLTVYENLALYYHYHYPQMSDEEIFERLDEHIERIGFTDDITSRPSTLSAGERSMIGLIRRSATTRIISSSIRRSPIWTSYRPKKRRRSSSN